MEAVAFIVFLVTAFAVSLMNDRHHTRLSAVGALGLALGLAGFGFLVYGPRAYLTRWPALASVAHPYLLVLYSAISIVLGVAILSGVVARRILQIGRRRNRGKSKNPQSA